MGPPIKYVRSKGEGVSENHQIWAYVLYGWSQVKVIVDIADNRCLGDKTILGQLQPVLLWVWIYD